MVSLLIKFLLKHPKKLLVATVIITVVLGYFLPGLEMVTSIERLYPSEKDVDRQIFDRSEELFGEDPGLIVVIGTDDVFRVPTLTKIRKLTREIEQIPGVKRVDSLANAKRIISTETEMRAEDFLVKIPQQPREIEALRAEYFSNPLYRNAYVTENSRWAVLLVVLDTTAQEANLTPIVREVYRLAKQYRGPERIFVSGRSELSVKFNDMMQRDRARLIPLVILVMLVVLYFNFRSLLGFALPLISVFIGVIWTFGLMSLFHLPISILTSVLPSVLIALGSSYAIYFLSAYFAIWDEEEDPIQRIVKVMNRTTLAVMFCAFTTIIGFFCLWFNDIQLIKELGLAAAIGIASLLALTAFILPAFFVVVGMAQRKRSKPPLRLRLKKYACLERLPEKFLGRAGSILIVWGCIVIACLFFVTQVRIENDPSTFFKKSSETSKDLQTLVKNLTMYGRFNIILEGDEEDTFKRPEVLMQIERLQNRIGKYQKIGKTMSLADFIKTINKSFNEHRPEFERVPATKNEVAQYFLLYSLTGDEENLYRYVTEDYRTSQITINTGTTSSVENWDLAGKIAEDCQQVFHDSLSCKISGPSLLLAKGAYAISYGVFKGFGIALVVILVLMFFLFRSVKIGLIAMIPNVIPILMLLGFMGLAGIPMSIGTSVILTIALGIAIDDTLHFFVHYYQELKQSNHFLIRERTGIPITDDQQWAVVHTWRHLYRALITTSMTIIFGFMVLAFSELVPLILFGVLTSMTMLFALLTDLFLTPALILKTRF